MFKILRYNIKDHAKGMQNLLDKYIVPNYLKRMGLSPENQLAFVDYEPVLDPIAAYDKKLEPHSLVAVDNDGKMIGCQTNFYMDTNSYLEDEFKLDIQSDSNQLRDIIDSISNKASDTHKWFEDVSKTAIQLNDIFETYRTEKFVVMESTVVDMNWRKHDIAFDLHKESLNVLNENELIILEGMVPGFVSLEKTIQRQINIGFRFHSTLFKNDGYAGPIFYRPPQGDNCAELY